MAYANGQPHGNLIDRNTEAPAKLTVRQAAARYGVSVTTIYRRVRAGRIVAAKNNRGHWEIVNNGRTLEIAELAADMRNRFAARNALEAAPVNGPARKFTNELADDMFDRRRKALANRGLAA